MEERPSHASKKLITPAEKGMSGRYKKREYYASKRRDESDSLTSGELSVGHGFKRWRDVGRKFCFPSESSAEGREIVGRGEGSSVVQRSPSERLTKENVALLDQRSPYDNADFRPAESRHSRRVSRYRGNDNLPDRRYSRTNRNRRRSQRRGPHYDRATRSGYAAIERETHPASVYDHRRDVCSPSRDCCQRGDGRYVLYGNPRNHGNGDEFAERRHDLSASEVRRNDKRRKSPECASIVDSDDTVFRWLSRVHRECHPSCRVQRNEEEELRRLAAIHSSVHYTTIGTNNACNDRSTSIPDCNYRSRISLDSRANYIPRSNRSLFRRSRLFPSPSHAKPGDGSSPIPSTCTHRHVSAHYFDKAYGSTNQVLQDCRLQETLPNNGTEFHSPEPRSSRWVLEDKTAPIDPVAPPTSNILGMDSSRKSHFIEHISSEDSISVGQVSQLNSNSESDWLSISLQVFIAFIRFLITIEI